jgi:uncharacterized protein GlcG (DUF336 family)
LLKYIYASEGAIWVSISIELARRIVEASKQRARELQSPVSIAIVDAGGHLVLFERMMAPYGWATGNISLAKANTAVMFNQSTDAIAQWGSGIPGFASSMASMTDGKFIMAAGGWPIRANGATIGGIGVSGGNAPGRDDEIARAGLAATDIASPPQPQLYIAPQPQIPAYTPPATNQVERPLVERRSYETPPGAANAQGQFYTRQLPPEQENPPHGEAFQDEYPGDHS